MESALTHLIVEANHFACRTAMPIAVATTIQEATLVGATIILALNMAITINTQTVDHLLFFNGSSPLSRLLYWFWWLWLLKDIRKESSRHMQLRSCMLKITLSIPIEFNNQSRPKIEEFKDLLASMHLWMRKSDIDLIAYRFKIIIILRKLVNMNFSNISFILLSYRLLHSIDWQTRKRAVKSCLWNW